MPSSYKFSSVILLIFTKILGGKNSCYVNIIAVHYKWRYESSVEIIPSIWQVYAIEYTYIAFTKFGNSTEPFT